MPIYLFRFKIPESVDAMLMKIQQGSGLGKPFTPFYLLLLASGLACLIFSGIRMARPRLKSRPVN